MASEYRERASFYRAALLLGLVRGDVVLTWADDVIAHDADSPAAFVEIATTPPGDLTVLRERLLVLCDVRESAGVARELLGLVHRDLASGRRSLKDTMTVLKQFRGWIAVDAAMNDRIKTLGVDYAMAAAGSSDAAGAAQRVRDWLRQFDP